MSKSIGCPQDGHWVAFGIGSNVHLFLDVRHLGLRLEVVGSRSGFLDLCQVRRVFGLPWVWLMSKTIVVTVDVKGDIWVIVRVLDVGYGELVLGSPLE